jgi:hypothetical protein
VTRLLLAAALLSACAGGDKPMDSKNPSPSGLPVVETIDQAVAAKGQRVLVRGTAQREKMGDTIQVEEALTVHCIDVRFPDAAIGKPVAAEGTLVVKSGYAATTGPNGEISQGTDPDSDDSRWVLTGCTLR